MDDDASDDAFAELKTRELRSWDVAQIAAGTGLAVYAVWVGLLQPGFRKVPLRLQVLEAYRQGFTSAVGYELNPWLVCLARFHAWRAGHHCNVSYRREDLWKVDLTECKNITVFLAPSVLSLLQKKMEAELPDDALVVAGRFPIPDWTPCRIEGHGVDRAWAYNMQAQRPLTSNLNKKSTVGNPDDTDFKNDSP
ncbi:adenine nucleotide translocase lysine N-methyltransferase isoform X3 [Corythoichthys intestinalis]|uniref:adenine nucleotide translocase lysine N-methyltransferase isoform X3 n=1 Tax=Corythoichthys intestinalis TaxID=161448 RepID=UPI0025A57BCE|nr:adenine nucleotide translocase lysine N-methyltransferase isoform X3 [Corythoichthys intestinalis]